MFTLYIHDHNLIMTEASSAIIGLTTGVVSELVKTHIELNDIKPLAYSLIGPISVSVYNKKLTKKTVAGDILNYSLYEFVTKKLIEKTIHKHKVNISKSDVDVVTFVVATIVQDQIIRNVGLFPKRKLTDSVMSTAIALVSRETLTHLI